MVWISDVPLITHLNADGIGAGELDKPTFPAPAELKSALGLLRRSGPIQTRI